MMFNISAGQKVKVFAGTTYIGEVVDVKTHGFWLTEDYETEEYISFIDTETIKILE
ncbi:hypothetical protein JOC77_004294 [Peribacillus deserti]|uniref:DUF2187 domain-containing protein n=1 Tax=Peribacillus deserti TaxID=673318 RepID=A0ABS2QP58_9BACI|nr:hypothetical protein [Peribacillus deserti]MBM7694815.1 hypothetical protein [Peribacillus deserti]